MSLTPIFRVLLVCFLATAAFSSCKKDKKNNDPGGGTTDENIDNVTAVMNTQEGAALTFKNSFEAGKDSLDAFIDMAKWVLQQPDVNKVFVTNASVLRIEYKNGLEGFVVAAATDAQGNPYDRGGGGDRSNKPGGVRNLYKSTNGDYIIENKKVLVFSPHFPPVFDYNQKLANGKVKLQATQVTGKDADLAIINTFKDYGLVVINTHGLPHGFAIRCKVDALATPHVPDGRTFTRDEIREMFTEANGLPLDKILANELSLTKYVYYQKNPSVVYTDAEVLVRDKYIRNLPQMSNAIVFGNFCYSGFTYDGPSKNNTSEAFKSIGAVAFFGYAFSDGSSAIVPNPWAHYMEDSLITNLIDGDSTGIAHLANNVTLQDVDGRDRISTGTWEKEMSLEELNRGNLVFTPVSQPAINDFAFRHFFDPRYKYGCGTFTDPRDGEVYELACVGDKRWFAENLRYNAQGSILQNNSQTNLEEYGRFYSYESAVGSLTTTDPNQPTNIQGICPQGWHVPNHYDFAQLRNSINFTTNLELATMLRAPSSLWTSDPHANDPKINATGFSAYPSGSAAKDKSSGTVTYYYNGVASYFWLTSVLSQEPLHAGQVVIAPTGIGWGDQVSINPNIGTHTLYLPCRCVEN